ncbi:MAG: DUF6090 family protein [Saprospiraceae bacterium]|nr:DUF6090 family protein [Saprospiraceae bacterium]
MSKYLFYAFGEIVLVVIGILIALQINNWNDYRKLRIEEGSALENLRADFRENIASIDFCIRHDRSVVRSLDIVMDHLKYRKPYSDSLDYHFPEILEWCAYSLLRSTYENVKSSKGLDLITNDSLRNGIINLHEEFYPFATENVDKDEEMVHRELMLPMFADLFIMDAEEKTAVPIDYEELSNNPRLINVLQLTKSKRLWSIEIDIDLRNTLSRLVDQIDAELGR